MEQMGTNSRPITASMLYNLAACPHRVSMDLFADPAERDDVSPFVQLLWDRGQAHEQAVIADLGAPFLDLSGYADDEKEARTIAALREGVPLIYSGRIRADDLLGVPDLLRNEDGGYVAGDIKSGAGEESGSEEDKGKAKKSYAVQLALYTDVLERLGKSAGRYSFIWDIHGDEVLYDFDAIQGVKNPRSLWDDYVECLTTARAIVSKTLETRGAYSSTCKDCVWYTACVRTLHATDDLTLIFDLGRAKRDAMIDRIATLHELAEINSDEFITDKGKKTVFKGIGPDTLRKLQARAALAVKKGGRPYLRIPVTLPAVDRELFFDIEVDPMRDVCYLHGFVERNAGDTKNESFHVFFC